MSTDIFTAMGDDISPMIKAIREVGEFAHLNAPNPGMEALCTFGATDLESGALDPSNEEDDQIVEVLYMLALVYVAYKAGQQSTTPKVEIATTSTLSRVLRSG